MRFPHFWEGLPIPVHSPSLPAIKMAVALLEAYSKQDEAQIDPVETFSKATRAPHILRDSSFKNHTALQHTFVVALIPVMAVLIALMICHRKVEGGMAQPQGSVGRRLAADGREEEHQIDPLNFPSESCLALQAVLGYLTDGAALPYEMDADFGFLGSSLELLEEEILPHTSSISTPIHPPSEDSLSPSAFESDDIELDPFLSCEPPEVQVTAELNGPSEHSVDIKDYRPSPVEISFDPMDFLFNEGIEVEEEVGVNQSNGESAMVSEEAELEEPPHPGGRRKRRISDSEGGTSTNKPPPAKHAGSPSSAVGPKAHEGDESSAGCVTPVTSAFLSGGTSSMLIGSSWISTDQSAEHEGSSSNALALEVHEEDGSSTSWVTPNASASAAGRISSMSTESRWTSAGQSGICAGSPSPGVAAKAHEEDESSKGYTIPSTSAHHVGGTSSVFPDSSGTSSDQPAKHAGFLSAGVALKTPKEDESPTSHVIPGTSASAAGGPSSVSTQSSEASSPHFTSSPSITSEYSRVFKLTSPLYMVPPASGSESQSHPAAATSLEFHLYYRLPVLEEGELEAAFDVSLIYGGGSFCKNAFRTLCHMRDLLAEPRLSISQAKELLVEAGLLANWLLTGHTTGFQGKPVCRAFEMLGIRYLYLEAIVCAKRVLGPAMKAEQWWFDFVKHIPTAYIPYYMKPRSNSLNLARLCTQLSRALMVLKDGQRPSAEETVAIKRGLFRKGTTTALFENPRWDKWRDLDTDYPLSSES
ncbi:hypothetical protein Efla_002548 [Eimeria flavescens]